MSSDQDMSPQGGRHASPFELDMYERSETNILRLKDNLPENTVANLAREVIRRVVSKGIHLENVVEMPTDAELEELAFALISNDDSAGKNLIQNLRDRGKGGEDIYLAHLAAAARLLGAWWEEDRVNFVQVTLGTGRIFAIMRSMRHLFEPASVLHSKAAVFATVPGENHTLGVRMAADLFRKDGWDITLKVGLDHDSLVEEIEQTPTGIIGLSFSGVHSIDALSRLVVAINISCPHAFVFVSGRDLEEAKPLLDLMSIDGQSSDLDEAKDLLSAFWNKRAAL